MLKTCGHLRRENMWKLKLHSFNEHEFWDPWSHIMWTSQKRSEESTLWCSLNSGGVWFGHFPAHLGGREWERERDIGGFAQLTSKTPPFEGHPHHLSGRALSEYFQGKDTALRRALWEIHKPQIYFKQLVIHQYWIILISMCIYTTISTCAPCFTLKSTHDYICDFMRAWQIERLNAFVHIDTSIIHIQIHAYTNHTHK